MAVPFLNSVMQLLLPQNISPSVPPDLRGYIEELSSSIQQLQSYIEQYAGFTQKLSSLWSQLAPTDTLLSGNTNRLYIKTSEVIALGAFVNIFNNGGVMTARNASAADNTKPAYGWCSTTGGIGSGLYGEIICMHGLHTYKTGLAIGSRYFLDISAGGNIVAAEPAAVGNIGQFLGTAITTTMILVDINGQWIQH